MRYLTSFWCPAYLLAAAGLQAQTPELAKDLDRSRKATVSYLEAAPDSILGFRPTPGVRSLAEQIEHIGLVADLLSAAAVATPSGGSMSPGACQCLGSKEDLGRFVEAAFGRATARLASQTPAELASPATFFGITRSRAGWFQWIQEHSAWTLGQVVPYLRLNRITPPAYLPI